MRRHAWSTRLLVLALVTAAGGCRGDHERVLETGRPTSFLTCPPPAAWPEPDSAVIGRAGGTLRVGDNVLTVPADAVPNDRTFTLSVIRSDTVGVILTSRPPAQFAKNKSATLAIDLTRCGADLDDPDDWSIWRFVNPAGNGQKLRTTVAPGRAEARLDSTSYYMIAN